MQAKQLHEVLARVVAWHNRHPLALRISPTQVHSIGGVALPFASAVKPAQPPAAPTLHEVLDPPAADAFASFVAGADPAAAPEAPARDAPVLADEALTAQPEPGTAAAGPAPHLEATAGSPPVADAPAQPADAPEPPALPELPEPAAGDDDATPDDDAPIELALALDEAAAQADAEAAAALAQESDAAPAVAESSPGAANDDLAAPSPDDTPFTGTETQVLPPPATAGPDANSDAAVDVDVDLQADSAAGAPLAARLQAARERAMAGGVHADGAGVDIALDGAAAFADPAAVPVSRTPQGWLARLWAGLPLGFIGRRRPVLQAGAAAPAGVGAGRRSRLAPLFSQDFMWPRTPRQVARWVQRHGAEAPLAPDGWPQRQIETDAALLQAARRQGLPHAVTRHVLTAAIGVGDRRIRLLIDEQGHILGPRAFDRRRIGLLGSGGAALAAGLLAAVLGPWRQAAPAQDDEAAAQVEAAAASAAVAESAASAASAAMAAASAASDAAAGQAASAHAAHDAQSEAHAAAAPASAPDEAHADAPADAHGAAPANAEGAAHAGEPASAAPVAAASAAGSVVAITHEPPPRWPVTRASGPLVAIRLRLSDEAKAAARAEVAAARASVRGEAAPSAVPGAAAPHPAPAAQPAQGPGTAPRPGPQETAVRVAQQPGMVYAVVTPAMPQRESAEAILAQMMSVRARIPPPVPDHGEVMAHQGRWRAAWWPFATLADAERARAMLVARGMRAEIIEF